MTDGPDIVWYFAYGSNMETATFAGRRGIAYRRAVPARVPGWRLVLDKPGIVPVGHGFAHLESRASYSARSICTTAASSSRRVVSPSNLARIVPVPSTTKIHGSDRRFHSFTVGVNC